MQTLKDFICTAGDPLLMCNWLSDFCSSTLPKEVKGALTDHWFQYIELSILHVDNHLDPN